MCVCVCAGVLYYVGSTVNPILYNLMSYRYRRAFCDTLHCLTRWSSCQRSSCRRVAMSRELSSRGGLARQYCNTNLPGICSSPAIKSTSLRSSHQQHIIGQEQPCHDHQYRNHIHHLHHPLQQPQLVHRGFSERVSSVSSALIMSTNVRALPHTSHVTPLSMCCS